MSQKNTDFRKIRKLIKIMQENDLVEVEIKHGDEKILLKRSHSQQQTITAVPMNISEIVTGVNTAQPDVVRKQTEQIEKIDDDLLEIVSPIVGTFYATPSPDSQSFVEIGTQVEPQTVVCIIEAMKVMNEIKSDVSGSITEILVASGQAIEYGQPLFKVKPN